MLNISTLKMLSKINQNTAFERLGTLFLVCTGGKMPEEGLTAVSETHTCRSHYLIQKHPLWWY